MADDGEHIDAQTSGGVDGGPAALDLAPSFSVHLATGVEASAELNGGAASVTIDGTTDTGLAGGNESSTPGWDGTSGYQVICDVGVSRLVIDHV